MDIRCGHNGGFCSYHHVEGAGNYKRRGLFQYPQGIIVHQGRRYRTTDHTYEDIHISTESRLIDIYGWVRMLEAECTLADRVMTKLQHAFV